MPKGYDTLTEEIQGEYEPENYEDEEEYIEAIRSDYGGVVDNLQLDLSFFIDKREREEEETS